MKRLAAMILCAVLWVGAVSAENIDLASMTYDELVELKDCLNIAIWQSENWSEVTVPVGYWQVGVDIPAGTYALKTNMTSSWLLAYTDIDENGLYVGPHYSFDLRDDAKEAKSPIDVVELSDGMSVLVDNGEAIFIPYQIDTAQKYNRISQMLYSELMALKAELDQAIWEKGKWLDITVRPGIIQVGKDIPAGWWRISTDETVLSAWIQTGLVLYDDGSGIHSTKSAEAATSQMDQPNFFFLGSVDKLYEVVVYLPDGMYVDVSSDPILFSTHAGKDEFAFEKNAR